MKLSEECQLIIKHILKKADEYNANKKYFNQVSVTINRIQKILYFIQIEYIKHTGNTMFEDDFYALPAGPGIKGVHDLYIDYATGQSDALKFPSGNLSQDKKQFIDIVLENTNSIDNVTLSKYSRKVDNLWINAYTSEDSNKLISKSLLINYYKPKNKPQTKKRTKRNTRYYKRNAIK